MGNLFVTETLKQGDEKYLVQIYELHRDEFIKWSFKNFSATIEQSKDAFQEAILDFYENVVTGKLTVLTSSLKTYLFQIGRNKVLNILKKEKRITYQDNLQLIKGNEYEDYMEDDNKVYSQEQISSCINKLPQDCQEVLKLHYFKEYDMESIAREMSYKNADTAKSKKSLCLKKLIVELNKIKLLVLL